MTRRELKRIAEQRLTEESVRHHPGFSVDNVDDVIEDLKRRDVNIVSEPHDVPVMGLRVAFFADPWDNLFEVIQYIANNGETIGA